MNGRFWRILLKKSKIAGLRKYREMSNVGDLSRCKALQNQYGRRWSLLR
jgi:hypothetical protein